MKEVVYRFGAVDYVIFTGMLLLSAMTGVYFACKSRFSKKRERVTLKDYLTGNRNLKAFPVSMSLIASYVSGVTMLGTPAEIYNFGSLYSLIIISMMLSGFTVATVYVPVFTKLQVCSSYEYLELRFSKTLRTLASLFFLLDEIMFLPMLIYVPSLAFNQVSGVNVHIVGAVVCAVCVFYTILGGLRAVVYTDTWQTVIMFIAVVVVMIVGTIAIGGVGEIFDRSIEGQRLQALNFSPSMYERYTVFSVLIGGYIYWTSFNAVNQTMVQRYLSLPNDRQAKIAVGLFTLGVVIFISMCCYNGLLVYSTYNTCDPLTSQRISTSDQLLPLFVVETAGHLKGVSGLFIAGVFGAALSSLSVVFNSAAVVILEDFCRGQFHIELSEKHASLISKIIVLVLGCVAQALILVVQHMGGIFEVTTSLTAIVAGTIFGVFTLGMTFPWANTKGAVAGAISGFIISCLISYGSRYAVSTHVTVAKTLPISVDGCMEIYGLNITEPEPTVYPDESGIFFLFRLSYLWITPIGVLTVFIVGIITSFLTGKTDLRSLDPDLISPVCQRFLPAEAYNYAGSAVKKIQHQRLLGGDTSVHPENLEDLIDSERR